MTMSPVVVLDIGVRGGPNRRWFPFGSQVTIFGIDADSEECSRLSAQPSRGLRIEYLPYALGREEGLEAVLHITRQSGCSSLLKPNETFLASFPYRSAFDVVNTRRVTLTTLDSVCRFNDIRPDVIKLDTQGTELDILQGGQTALERSCLIELEVEFNPVYIDQPLFGDVDEYLRRKGFALLGLRRDYWRRHANGETSLGGTLVHGDALFYRVEVPPERIQQFALALAAYHQFDFISALGLPIPAAIRRRSAVQRAVGKFIGAIGDHRRCRRWLDWCRPAGAVDWHDADFF